MKNENNRLKLATKKNLLIIELKEGITVAIPTTSKLSNAKVLEVFEDGSFSAHWSMNWNESGDFATELMSFDNDLALNKKDFKARNKRRTDNGLQPIK